MRATARILPAMLLVLAGCCRKTTIENQQGSLTIDDGTNVVSGKADDFGSPCPGTPTAKTLSLVNTGLGDVEVSAVAISGSDFTDAPPSLPFTVPAGGTVSLPVTFLPTAVGPAAATLTVVSNAQNSPSTVSLTGTGGSGGPEPDYSASCNYLENGNPFSEPYPCDTLLWQVNAGSTGNDTLVVSDDGCPPVVIQSATFTGNDAGVFTLPGLPTLPASVPPGSPLTVTVAYGPLSAGGFDMATLTLVTNDPVNSSPGAVAGTFVYNLTGTGLAPAVALSPSPWDFGAATMGQEVFTVLNQGTLPVTLQAPSLATGAPYAISNGWSSGTVLSAQGATDGGPTSVQCTVTFTSPGNGLFQDQLIVDYSSAEGNGTATDNLIAHSASGLCASSEALVLPATGFCGTVSAQLVIGNCGDVDLEVTSVGFSDAGDPEGTFSVTLPSGTTLPVEIPPDAGIGVTVIYADNGRLTDPAGTLLIGSNDPSAPDGGTLVSVETDVSPVPPPSDSPAQLPDSGVGVGVTTVFVAGGTDTLYSYAWSVLPATNITLVSDAGYAWVTPSSGGKYNVCLQEYEVPLDGGATCGIDSGVPGNCTQFNP